jgi:hypothetical protein
VGEGWGRRWEGVGLVEEGREDVSCIQVQDYQQLTFMVSHTMGGVGEGEGRESRYLYKSQAYISGPVLPC